MGIHTFVWGFSHDQPSVIDALRRADVIEPRCWFTEIACDRRKVLAQSNVFYMNYFFSQKWIEQYREQLIQYTQSHHCEYEMYRNVYNTTLCRFIDHYSRHDKKFQSRTIHSYVNQFNLLFQFFYGVFKQEQIKLALFVNIPHEGVELVAYQIAKALNLRTIVLTQSLAPNKVFYMEDVEDFGDFHFMTAQEDATYIELKKNFFHDHFYMRTRKKHPLPSWNDVMRAIRQCHRLPEQIAHHYLRYRKLHAYRTNLSRIVVPVDYRKKYVYFPLHLQPELTTSALGGMFNDQILALEVLSQQIPTDWVIYVKENPKQREFMRDETFFERLKLLDNVQMTPLEESTFKLIEHSQFVATITGTAGWEAICGGKPALVFGQAWYQKFEGVFQWHQDMNVGNIVNCQIDHKKLEKDYNELISKCATGVVDKDYKCIVENYDEEKNVRSLSMFLRRLIIGTDQLS